MSYQESKTRYLKATQCLERDTKERARLARAKQELALDLSEANERLIIAEANQKKTAGTGKDKASMELLKEAHRNVSIAKELLESFGDVPDMAYSIRDDIGFATGDFHRAIVQAEINKVPDEAWTFLHRAFAIWGGGYSDRWKEFLQTLPINIPSPISPNLNELRSKVIADHTVVA